MGLAGPLPCQPMDVDGSWHGPTTWNAITGRSLGGLFCAPRYATGYLYLLINSSHVMSLVAVATLSPLFQVNLCSG